MESKVESIRAFDKECIGAKRFMSDIMISIMPEDHSQGRIHDFFLTQEQAVNFKNGLEREISQNIESEKLK